MFRFHRFSTRSRGRTALAVALVVGASIGVAGRASSSHDGDASPMPEPMARKRPTLFLIGDSTVRNGTKGQRGWGDPLTAYFDPEKIRVANRARGGRSSRTFLTEGLWEQVLAEMQPGDFVLVQFGHNDGGSPETSYRASLKGSGDETREVVNPQTGKKEVIRTYGWNLRRYLRDARAKGVTPVVLSPIPRNRRGPDGKVYRASGDYGRWAAEAAKAEGAAFVDLNALVAEQYDAMKKEEVDALFGGDWTHTNAAGAERNAASVIAGLKGLKRCPLCRFLSAKGEGVAAAPAHVHDPPPTPMTGDAE